MTNKQAGWDSNFSNFSKENKAVIIKSLEDFINEVNRVSNLKSQKPAWKNSVDELQVKIEEVINKKQSSHIYDVILEYELPYDYRRPDGILLLKDSVAVLEFKGYSEPSSAAIDQVHDYARDLESYHKECHNKKVHPILINMAMNKSQEPIRGVNICSPKDLGKLIINLDDGKENGSKVLRDKFLSNDIYCPLPSLIKVAREVFNKKQKSVLWNSIVNTDNATKEIKEIINSAVESAKKKGKSKNLVLLTGVPGAGKTLVGLRIVHYSKLDKFASKKSTLSSKFLTGNDPLFRVLKHELQNKTFINMINKYNDHYHKYQDKPLNEHVIVFDEAQRAWDEEKVSNSKRKVKSKLTEPESLISFAERNREDKDWTVLIGLIGNGQEIQIGEESGINLWVNALNKYEDWNVYISSNLKSDFSKLNSCNNLNINNNLHLADSIRSHKSNILHEYVENLLEFSDNRNSLKKLADTIEEKFIFYISRDLSKCRSYLLERYNGEPDKRFGKIASSRALKLIEHGFNNEYMALQSLKNVLGPWYANGKDKDVSCCNLCDCVTEFEIQGLELDATLLCWGSDFFKIESKNKWCIDYMKQYSKLNKLMVKNPENLRKNAYRVLLTRARDTCIVYVPKIAIKNGSEDILRETYQYLKDCGMKEL